MLVYLLRQLHVLPHWDRSYRSNFLPHPVTVYWHRANQSQRWPYNARLLAGQPSECQFWSHWYDSTREKSRRKRDSNPGSFALEADALTTRPTRQWRGRDEWNVDIIVFWKGTTSMMLNYSAPRPCKLCQCACIIKGHACRKTDTCTHTKMETQTQTHI